MPTDSLGHRQRWRLAQSPSRQDVARPHRCPQNVPRLLPERVAPSRIPKQPRAVQPPALRDRHARVAWAGGVPSCSPQPASPQDARVVRSLRLGRGAWTSSVCVACVISMTVPQMRRSQFSAGGVVYRLPPGPHLLLQVLLMNVGRVVVYDDIIGYIWPDPDREPDYAENIGAQVSHLLEEHRCLCACCPWCWSGAGEDMIKADDHLIERFMTYVDVLPSGCWFWTGARSRGKGNKKWYGSFWIPELRMSVRAHRFSSEVINGHPCPAGHHRDHTCEFSLCVCPDHIEVVTHEENERRRQVRRLARQTQTG